MAGLLIGCCPVKLVIILLLLFVLVVFCCLIGYWPVEWAELGMDFLLPQKRWWQETCIHDDIICRGGAYQAAQNILHLYALPLFILVRVLLTFDFRRQCGQGLRDGVRGRVRFGMAHGNRWALVCRGGVMTVEGGGVFQVRTDTLYIDRTFILINKNE